LQEKVAELQEFHDVVVGRELRMMELEEENRQLWLKVKHLERGEPFPH
jgi:hypothetical protein